MSLVTLTWTGVNATSGDTMSATAFVPCGICSQSSCLRSSPIVTIITLQSTGLTEMEDKRISEYNIRDPKSINVQKSSAGTPDLRSISHDTVRGSFIRPTIVCLSFALRRVAVRPSGRRHGFYQEFNGLRRQLRVLEIEICNEWLLLSLVSIGLTHLITRHASERCRKLVCRGHVVRHDLHLLRAQHDDQH